MEDECLELKSTEMDALMAIYGESEQFEYSSNNDNGLISGKLIIEIDSISVQELVNNSTAPNIEYLPPITMKFTLTALYPLQEPPSITIECSWLNDFAIEMIKTRLDEIWELEHGICVLHSFIDILTHDLHLIKGITVNLQKDAEAIVVYNRERRLRDFEAQSFDCAICMEEQSGRHCIELSCHHVFCRSCLSLYLGILIAEGSIAQLKCPDTQCRRLPEQPEIKADEMQQLLNEEQISRFQRLQEQRKIDSDGSKYAWCPRQGCGLGVECDKTIERLCECDCGYVFCKLCLRTWHGNNHCEIKNAKRIIELYIRAVRQNQDQTVRAKLEGQYGEATLKRMLAEYDRESASMDLIRKSTQKCPKCCLRIQKTYGCNHMQCSQCHTHFCYLCGTVVDKTNPMAHFNSARSQCRMRLFDGIEGSVGYDREQQLLLQQPLQEEQDEINLMIQLAFEDDNDS
ncbi:hypothetical protein LPJ64_003118 [Coemansia asiatica]|uniref:RBR-type E3 ubiquitin transferase n=1 Tax=Coemansia asiatica TaxID=1052880 RepID=A0A9W7XIF6_9FUNG|nr:hypothetical protein LPJ64_003118 [Coemansia asiatica]